MFTILILQSEGVCATKLKKDGKGKKVGKAEGHSEAKTERRKDAINPITNGKEAAEKDSER